MSSNTMTTAIELAERWQAAKADENAANARRIAIEACLLYTSDAADE